MSAEVEDKGMDLSKLSKDELLQLKQLQDKMKGVNDG